MNKHFRFTAGGREGAPPFRGGRGVTLVEIVFVFFLGSMVLLFGSQLSSRTSLHVRKGTEMLNVQAFLDQVVERLRSDVRSLTRLITCNDHELTFVTTKKGRNEVLSYRYDKQAKSLVRRAADGAEKAFAGADQIETLLFKPVPNTGAVRFVHLLIRIRSKEPGEGTKGTRLSFVSQFFPQCLPRENPFRKGS